MHTTTFLKGAYLHTLADAVACEGRWWSTSPSHDSEFTDSDKGQSPWGLLFQTALFQLVSPLISSHWLAFFTSVVSCQLA